MSKSPEEKEFPKNGEEFIDETRNKGVPKSPTTPSNEPAKIDATPKVFIALLQKSLEAVERPESVKMIPMFG
jgi:hypothetical protein